MYNFMLIYINFSFDFLGLDNIDFENYFANELIHAMHNASFALGTWKRVASKQGRWVNPKFVFAILCSFSR